MSAADVDDTFAANLLNANYGSYNATSMEVRRCVVERGYAVRDTLAAFANALQVGRRC